MIYTSARFANAEHTLVQGTDADGNSETVPTDHTVFRCPEHGPLGFLASGGVIADYEAPPEPSPYQPLRPYQFWTAVRATDNESSLRTWASALEDPLQKAAATSMLEFSLEYRYDHPLMDAARAVLDIPENEFQDLWLWAMTL